MPSKKEEKSQDVDQKLIFWKKKNFSISMKGTLGMSSKKEETPISFALEFMQKRPFYSTKRHGNANKK